MTDPNASGDVVVRDVVHPLDAQQITQSVDPYTIVDGTSIACSSGSGTREQGWWRLFDLDDDHGLVGEFSVDSVDWATQSVTGDGLVTVNVYCMDEGLPFFIQFLTLQDSAVVPLADEVLTFHNSG